MVEIVDVAVIGAGAIGRTHVGLLARMPGLRLAAIVDPSPEAGALAASAGVPFHRDVESLLAGGLPAAAIVATPNETHLPICEALLRAGVPVLLEKPVAESLASALRLIAVADETAIPVLVGHHRRHNPIVRAARDVLRGARFGELVVASVTCTLAKPDGYFDARWRRIPGTGGPLLINLVHEIDLLRHFFGEIDTVQAIASNARRGFAVEDGAVVCLAFRRGGMATLAISDAATGPWAWDLTAGENPARFPAHEVSAHHYAGSLGALSLPDLTLWTPAGAPDWTRPLRRETVPAVRADPYEAQLSHFADLVRGSCGEPCVCLRDATANLIALDAIAKAAASGTRARVDLAPLDRAREAALADGTRR